MKYNIVSVSTYSAHYCLVCASVTGLRKIDWFLLIAKRMSLTTPNIYTCFIKEEYWHFKIGGFIYCVNKTQL